MTVARFVRSAYLPTPLHSVGGEEEAEEWFEDVLQETWRRRRKDSRHANTLPAPTTHHYTHTSYTHAHARHGRDRKRYLRYRYGHGLVCHAISWSCMSRYLLVLYVTLSLGLVQQASASFFIKKQTIAQKAHTHVKMQREREREREREKESMAQVVASTLVTA